MAIQVSGKKNRGHKSTRARQRRPAACRSFSRPGGQVPAGASPTAGHQAQTQVVLQPQQGGQNGGEGEDGVEGLHHGVFGDEDVVPVPQPEVDQLEAVPEHRRPEEDQNKGRAAAGDEGAPFPPLNEAVEGPDDSVPGAQVEQGGHRLHPSQHEGKGGGDEQWASKEKQRRLKRARIRRCGNGGHWEGSSPRTAARLSPCCTRLKTRRQRISPAWVDSTSSRRRPR